jgi:signal transduction histidine kinase
VSFRPLDFLGSIKLKLGVVIVFAVAVTVLVDAVGDRIGLSPLVTAVVAGAIALAVVQLLAHGMTSPLREMVAASRAMARGDYGRRVTATSRDEVGELARAFNSMATELAEVDRLRRDLVANASHELRTPIGALRAKLENLVDGIEPANRDALSGLLEQTERLSGLVDQLLDLSRLESGTVPLEREHVSAALLLQRVAEDWEPFAAERGVRLSVFVEPPELQLACDERRLGQALANLVANAVRHSPDQGEVVLHAGRQNGRVRCEVRDEGPGILPEEAERVFERFYRSDRGRSHDEGGSGLGLAIARWTVELHGGTIRVEDGDPHGCRMVVELPG